MDKLTPAELNERLSIALGIEPRIEWLLTTNGGETYCDVSESKSEMDDA